MEEFYHGDGERRRYGGVDFQGDGQYPKRRNPDKGGESAGVARHALPARRSEPIGYLGMV